MKALSASKVDCFFGCQRLFKYKYIDKVKTQVEPAYFAIGNIAHAALEEYHKSCRTKNNSVMEKSFKKALVSQKCMERVDKGELSLANLYNIKEMLVKYLKYIEKNKPGKILDVETFFTIKSDGVSIRGKADRVDLVDDSLVIIDYKSSSSVLSKKDILESVQLPTYAMWATKVYGNNNVTGKYIFIKKLGPRGGGIRELEITEELVNKAKEKYMVVWDALKTKETYTRNQGYKYCFNCEYKQMCNSDPE